MASIPMTAVAGPLSVTSTAHWIEHLDIAGAILTEPIRPADGAITAGRLLKKSSPNGCRLGITVLSRLHSEHNDWLDLLVQG